MNIRTILPVLLGLILAPALLQAEERPLPDGCTSQSLGSGSFRAYGNPKQITGHPFTTTGAKKISLQHIVGPRALLVNFWTTWCIPCKKEMPSMDRLQGRVSTQDLLIVPLVRDGKGLSEAVAFYKAYAIKNMPLAADRFGKIGHEHRIGALPQTLFVNREGWVVGMLVGGVNWEAPNVIKLVESCLDLKIPETKS
ncbi:TlpA disulfide reductase family protein [Magnetococcus sp. PR-3]|uniref:TlpA disulfide reductase family protein n=1 Tax=Magnetococcus sp. PR-3 TaxID=3120355 RepID=UPI002FCDE3FF